MINENKKAEKPRKKKDRNPYEAMGAVKIFTENDSEDTIELVNKISLDVNDCVNLSASTLQNQWENNLKQYMRAALAGDDKLIGRSKYVSSDVQERVDWFTAQIVAIFESQKQVVSFQPQTESPRDVNLAKQQNAVVNHVLREKNSHVGMLTPWVKNSAIYGLGGVHIGFDECVKEGRVEWLEGVTDEQLVDLVAARDRGELKIINRSDEYRAELPEELTAQIAPLAQQQGVDPEMLMQQAQALLPLVRDLGIRRITRFPEFTKTVLAPEDFIVSRDADFDSSTGGIKARYQGHHSYATKSDLVAQGFNRTLVESIAYAQQKTDGVTLQRTSKTDFNAGRLANSDEVDVYEIYTHTSIAKGEPKRHYRFTLAGDILSKPVLLGYEETSEFYPYAALVPFPLPNTLFGQGIADRVSKEQDLITKIERAVIDNLSQVVNPIKVVNPDVTNLDDLLNQHPGKVIRSSDPTGGISYTTPPFAAQTALPMVDMLRTRQDQITGVGGNMISINASDLQDVTATAVQERKSSQQMLIQHVCYHYANTGYRYLAKVVIDQMKGKPELAQAYITRLTDKFEPLEIDGWSADMDVSTNVEFGLMDKDYKTQTLMTLLSLQQQGLGQTSTPQNLYKTQVDIADTLGLPDPMGRFTEPSQIPPPPPAPDPNAGLVEIEKVKAQLKAQADQAERDFEAYKLRVQDDFNRDKMAQEFELAHAELQAKYAAQVDIRRLELEQEKERNNVDWAIAQEQAMTARNEQMAQQKQMEAQMAQQQAQMQQPQMPPQF
jgi:hypothetical protein